MAIHVSILQESTSHTPAQARWKLDFLGSNTCDYLNVHTYGQKVVEASNACAKGGGCYREVRTLQLCAEAEALLQQHMHKHINQRNQRNMVAI